MRIFVLLLFASFCLFPGTAESQGTIKGRVYDKASGSGLKGANVIAGSGRGTVAGENGRFILQIPAGSGVLSFQYVGYTHQQLPFRIGEGDTLELNIALEPEVVEMDQVVVSAGRIEQPVSELSVSMSLIRPRVLEQNHISDIKELINKTPGIEVLDGQASVRGGSGFSYGAGSRVLALVDGLPVMSADAGNIRWQFLPMENISQVEIIKGASSVVYGSSAVNGVINFRTADPGEKPATRFYAETGVYGNPRNENWKWSSSPRHFSSASFSHLRKWGNTGIAAGINLFRDEGYRRLNDQTLGRAHLRVKHENKQVEGLTYGMAVNGGATTKTDFVLWENGTSGALKQNPETAIELKSYFYTVDPFVTFRRNGNPRHDFRARWQSSQNRFEEAPGNNSQGHNLYAEYHYWHRFSEMVSLSAGVSENFSLVNSRFYGDHSGFNAGLFGQTEINATSRLRVSSGFRVEQNWLGGDAGAIVPLFRTGLNFRVLDFTFLRASFGQGYRYPSIAEKFASTTLGSVRIFPNPAIAPERGWSAEVGVKQGVTTPFLSGVIDLALFYSRYTNMIEFIFSNYPDPVTGEYALGFRADNVEAARVYGYELEWMLSGNAGRWHNSVTGGYVFMYPVEFSQATGKNSGVMLKYRRKHALSLNFGTQYNRLELGAGIYVRSKIMEIDDVFLNPVTREALLPGFYDYRNQINRGYLLADASIGWRPGKNYLVSLMVKNITNSEYMGRPGDVQPQRNFSLRLTGSY